MNSPEYIRNVFIVLLDPENMGVVDTSFAIFRCLVSKIFEIIVI